MMLFGAWAGMRHSISFAKILGVTGFAWALLSVLAELLRLHVDFVPQLVYGMMLCAITLNIHIERGVWPVVFEVLALVYLIAYVTRRSREQSGVGVGIGAIMVLSAALILQAMLLRAFGPDGLMNAADINQLHLRAVVSLMWSIFGAALAWWGTYNKSRSMWSTGSVLLTSASAFQQAGNVTAESYRE